MVTIFAKSKKGFFLFCLLVLAGSYPLPPTSSESKIGVAAGAGASCQADQSPTLPHACLPTGRRGGDGTQLDKNKYITIDEVRPGMDAYCLTGYKGAEIEKFGLEVLSVVRGVRPGQDAILVQGTDERFIHTGPVAGCSGSPVYIDGRLAGALAFMWAFSKDPLYGVTPIEDILRVGRGSGNQGIRKPGNQDPPAGRAGMGFVFDFSKPVDFAEIDKRITDGPRAYLRQADAGSVVALPCPLVTSGLPTEVCNQLGGLVKPFSLVAVGGDIAGSTAGGEPQTAGSLDYARDGELVEPLAPGSCLAVPLVTGDIKIEAIGAVTEVLGDKIYGFGHGLLEYGQIDLPIATAQVHTVVSSLYRSFRLARSVEIVGALTADESTGVCGQLGREAKMIPLTIRVARYNDAETRVYNCQVANNRLLTPVMLRLVVAGAALSRGELPPENTIAYKGVIDVAGFGPIIFENVSSGFDLAEMTADSVGPVAMLMNNPYEEVEVRSLEFDIQIMSKSTVAHIWSVDLSDSKVKAGRTIEITVVVESVLGGKKKYECSLRIPDELAPGEYNLIVSGGHGYGRFLKKAVPYRFVPQSLPGLVEAMNNVLAVKRDKLYCLLVLPAGGIAVEKAELPDLPATKALVLQDGKRTLSIWPYSHWLEQAIETGTVVVDKKVMCITVEE